MYIKMLSGHIERLVRPEAPMFKLPQDENGNRRRENSQPLYSNVTYNDRDFISSQEDNELLDESYEDEDSPNEICAFKLDQGKIDELANDYRVEMCVSSSRENAIQKASYEETVKSDGTPSRNEDESRCKSNRKRKTHRRMPKGVIIDLSNDIYGSFNSGIKISVISMHSLIPEIKFVEMPKKNLRSSTLKRTARNKTINKMLNNPVLAVFYTENCSKRKKVAKLRKQKCKNHKKKLIDNKSPSDINTTANIPKQLRNIDQQELHIGNNLPSFCPSNEILDSTKYCHHHDCAPVDINNVQYPVLDTEQTHADARKHIANYCSICNDQHREYHSCDREDCNADGSDFNTDMQADWTTEYFHPEYTHEKECRCFYDSSEYHLDINMRGDCYPLMSTRAARPLKNCALLRKRQREEAERFGSNKLQADIAPEFTTGTDEYSPSGIELSNRCSSCNVERRDLTSVIQKCVVSKASTLFDESVVDLGDSRVASASRCEIDMCPGKLVRPTTTTTTTTTVERDDERPNKSDSPKAADTWNETAWRDDCIGRRCGDHVVAEPSCSDQPPGEKGGYARGVDSKWKRDSIETDTQQLYYKWKRRIATVDAGMRTSVDFKGKCDPRYKSDEAIRVQLRESAEIRKRESLQMVEATSQTRSDNTNVDDKRRATRDYSLWTSLQMGKIWSQMHDACKNVVKLAATSVGRVVKNAPKSERSQRNPIEVVDATPVEDSSGAENICGETYSKNLIHLKNRKKLKTRQERTIGDVKKYREDTMGGSTRKKLQAVTPSRGMRKHVRRNVEKGRKNDKSCVFYSEHEGDKYRDIVEFLSRNETYGQDGNVCYQSRLTESSRYLENSMYPELRNRGGSDDKRDSTRSIDDKQNSVQRIYEDAKFIKSYRNSVLKKCACYNRTQKSRLCDQIHTTVRYEPSVNTDRQRISADAPSVFRNNPLYHKLLSTVSFPEDNKREEVQATPEQTTSYKKMKRYEYARYTAGAETERNLMSEIAEIADATVSTPETDLTVRSSRYDPDEPIASTSKWEPPLTSSEKSRENCPDLRSPFRATAVKFWKKRSRVDNKTIAPVFKRNRRSIGRRKPSTAAVTRDSGMKITQIEPSTEQTAREGNKRRTYVNTQMQTPATVTRILSTFLVSGKKKKKRVLMSITLQSGSDHDVSARKEAETQTSSNNVTSAGTDVLGDYDLDGYPQAMLMKTSKMLKCFVCDKPNCYEIKESDNSITLEEALIAEYPETFEANDYRAERRTDVEILP